MLKSRFFVLFFPLGSGRKSHRNALRRYGFDGALFLAWGECRQARCVCAAGFVSAKKLPSQMTAVRMRYRLCPLRGGADWWAKTEPPLRGAALCKRSIISCSRRLSYNCLCHDSNQSLFVWPSTHPVCRRSLCSRDWSNP